MSGSGMVRELTRTKRLEAAINNEMLTRQRVDQLEVVAKKQMEMLKELHDRLSRVESTGFWGRLKWLVRG